jgi:hypothetical protein
MKKNGFIVGCGTVAVLFAAVMLSGCATTGKTGVDNVGFYEDFENSVIRGELYITGYTGTSTIVDIPETIQGRSVRNIFGSAFSKKGLTAITIPDSVTGIGVFAFANNQLTAITIPNSVTRIGDSAFANNQLTEIILPNGVSLIGSGAFANNQLTAITIPNSVTEIGAGAFANNQLATITIPNSVMEIGSHAFANNQLRTVTIPNRTALSIDAFAGNDVFPPLLIPESGNTIIVFSRSIEGQINVHDASRTVTITGLKLGSDVVIPDTVYDIPVTRITNTNTRIDNIKNGMSEFTPIRNLTLPAGLAEISDNAFLGYTIQNVTFPNDRVEELWNRVYPAMASANQSLMQEWEQAVKQAEELAEQQKKNREFEEEMERLRSLGRAAEQYRRNLGN